MNPEFASSVALGKVLSLSEPQFVHLSNGLVIPFLHGCHENTCQVFQNRALSTWRHSSPSPGLPGRGFICTLMVSRRQCPPLTSAVHWATSEDQLGCALTFPRASASLHFLISLHDLPHPHILKLWGPFNPACEGQDPNLLPWGHGESRLTQQPTTVAGGRCAQSPSDFRTRTPFSARYQGYR